MKPALVVLKGADPRREDTGSAVATMRLIEVAARSFDVHLVCLGPADRVERPDSGPIRTVRVVRPDHQRSLAHRWILGGRSFALDRLGLVPLAQSIESCAAVRRALGEVVEDVGAAVVLGEHWPVGRAVSEVQGVHRVLRLMDVEHQNLRDRADRAAGLERLQLRLASRMVRRVETQAATAVDLALAVSAEDAAAFARVGAELRFVPIPVPARPIERRPVDGRVLFLGRLDWWPNIEGLSWFVDEVWPRILSAVPGARLRLVGGGDGSDRLDWMGAEGVDLVGWVDDLEGELGRAQVGVVPVRVGTGVKMKTIELMAAGLPVVSTSTGGRGTAATSGGAAIADDPAAFADRVVGLLSNEAARAEQSEAALASVATVHDPSHLADLISDIHAAVDRHG